ncbi:MAG: hypothetical protein C0501_22065 [Isosphaera sp.]|nr:hypothetical protein [Isosphaera sp.]
MRPSFVLAVAAGLAAPAPAPADTSSLYYHSLEWLTDSSDSVVEATVVSERVVRGGRGWTVTTVRSVDRVLKRVGKPAPPVAGDLTDLIPAPGEHRVLLFCGPAAREGPRLFDAPAARAGRETYCVFLNPWPAPKAGAKPHDPFGFLPNHGSAWERLEFRHTACVAIDKGAKVLTDPAAVVKLVEARVKAHPERVRAAGHYVYCGPKQDDGDVYNLLVPHEPEHKKGFLAGLGNKDWWTRTHAAEQLAHYPGADVAAALKAVLADGFVGDVVENGKRVRTYPVRRAAYDSLRALGVDVPRAELSPP